MAIMNIFYRFDHVNNDLPQLKMVICHSKSLNYQRVHHVTFISWIHQLGQFWSQEKLEDKKPGSISGHRIQPVCRGIFQEIFMMDFESQQKNTTYIHGSKKKMSEFPTQPWFLGVSVNLGGREYLRIFEIRGVLVSPPFWTMDKAPKAVLAVLLSS